MSTASKSRIALLYSVRFSRWTEGRPGLGLSLAARSSAASSQLTNVATSEASGRGAPGGGIWRVRNFRNTFSHSGAFSPTLLKFKPSSDTPPVLDFWLWQALQLSSISARRAAWSGVVVFCARDDEAA